LSRPVACGWRDDDTSASWGGDEEDDPDMLLQSTAVLATPRRLGRRVLIGRDTQLPRLLPLRAVVVVIALGDLVFLVLRLARSALLLCR
jgi:hypothetical protein